MCVTHYEEFGKIRAFEFVKKYFTDYQCVKDNALAGKVGKTARFFLGGEGGRSI